LVSEIFEKISKIKLLSIFQLAIFLVTVSLNNLASQFNKIGEIGLWLNQDKIKLGIKWYYLRDAVNALFAACYYDTSLGYNWLKDKPSNRGLSYRLVATGRVTSSLTDKTTFLLKISQVFFSVC